MFHSSFNRQARGTAILIHKKIHAASSVISDLQDCCVIVSGQHTPVLLVNLYAPTGIMLNLNIDLSVNYLI